MSEPQYNASFLERNCPHLVRQINEAKPEPRTPCLACGAPTKWDASEIQIAFCPACEQRVSPEQWVLIQRAFRIGVDGTAKCLAPMIQEQSARRMMAEVRHAIAEKQARDLGRIVWAMAACLVLAWGAVLGLCAFR